MKTDYPRDFTLGLVTSAGSMGIVIPPSIPIKILYCLVMNVSVAKLFMAGFMPGLLISLRVHGLYLVAGAQARLAFAKRRDHRGKRR